MVSQADIAEADAEIMKLPPARTFIGHIVFLMGWGNCLGDSFLSRGSLLSGNMLPTTMCKEKHTDCLEHADGKQNPSVDTAAVLLKRAASNPFSNAQDMPTKWTLLPNTMANPFADLYSITALPTESTTNHPPTSNGQALQSLIATLETSPADMEGRLRIISMQSSVYSQGSYLASETIEDAVSIAAFPYPPT
ncbi:hypothetical protein BKA82DRAFT_4432280 [Pisolithus tinctorius]|nr:hypothetical protein BKA82DRAFT_4432280 [Pisolithus tinctorius]